VLTPQPRKPHTCNNMLEDIGGHGGRGAPGVSLEDTVGEGGGGRAWSVYSWVDPWKILEARVPWKDSA
jgi:hypothetical protein